MPNESKEHITPKWLEEQQNSSWQIEILIAGGFLFTLLQVPEWVEYLFWEVSDGTGFQPWMSVLAIGIHVMSRVLLFGFVANLLLRAIWLAYLGINFTFPKGVDFEKLGYSDFFNEKEKKRPSVVQRILRLERLCSLSYSITIIMTMVFLTIFIVAVPFYMVIPWLTPSWFYDNPIYGYIIGFILLLVVLGILDGLFLKVFPKGIKGYYSFYKVFNSLTFRNAYRKEWLVLISNVGRWKMMVLFLLYFSLALLVSTDEVRSYLYLDGIPSIVDFESRKHLKYPVTHIYQRRFYEDKLEKGDRIKEACIASEIARDDFLPIFQVYDYSMESALDFYFEKYEMKQAVDSMTRYYHRYEIDTIFNKAINKTMLVYIDRKRVEKLTWFEARHPQTDERGFRAYVPVDSLPKGYHLITIQRKRVIRDSMVTQSSAIAIPFVKN